ncbi:DUF1120 domain-containing protein [Erwinia tasmaniensis]|uniref:DUF1120 domain-containing protein n=1 Tax=Erwinia tasmaniensis TaxID=338565 RepID=UPI003A4E5C98
MSIKIIVQSIALAGITCTTFNALADQAGDIHVHGKITLAGCSASVTSGQDLDYGSVPWSSLSNSTVTTLDAKDATLAISCTDAKQAAAFYITDTREGTAANGVNAPLQNGGTNIIGHSDKTYTFGLGNDSGNNPIGNYTITPTAVTVDGKSYNNYGFLKDTSHISTNFNVVNPLNKWSYRKTEDWTATDGKKVITGNDYVWTLAVQPQISPQKNLAMSGEIPFDGVAKINVRYW